MSECKQCPHVVGDITERDCAFPDCVGGWEEGYKQLADKLATVTKQRDRAWAALQLVSGYPGAREFVGTIIHDACIEALDEARKNGDD